MKIGGTTVEEIESYIKTGIDTHTYIKRAQQVKEKIERALSDAFPDDRFWMSLFDVDGDTAKINDRYTGQEVCCININQIDEDINKLVSRVVSGDL